MRSAESCWGGTHEGHSGREEERGANRAAQEWTSAPAQAAHRRDVLVLDSALGHHLQCEGGPGLPNDPSAYSELHCRLGALPQQGLPSLGHRLECGHN